MGIIYVCIPVHVHEGTCEWIESEGCVPCPPPTGQERNPTPAEIRQVLCGMADCQAVYHVRPHYWTAEVGNPTTRQGATIYIPDFSGDEQEPHDFQFDKSSPELVLRIASGLSRVCGPMACIPDTGETPIVVTPDTDPVEAIKVWQSES